MKTLTKLNIAAVLVVLLLLAGLNMASAQTKNEEGTVLKQFLTKQGYIPIPLQKYPTGHLYAEVVINGVKGRFIFDTGAGATVVEEKRKDKFKMASAPIADKATGAGGSGMDMQSSPNNKLSISGYTLDNYTAYMMNLDNINTTLKQLGYEEADGVIGADILSKGQSIIDYANMVIYLK